MTNHNRMAVIIEYVHDFDTHLIHFFCGSPVKDGNNPICRYSWEILCVQHPDTLHTCLDRRILPFCVLLKGSFESSLKDIPFYGSVEHQREPAF